MTNDNDPSVTHVTLGLFQAMDVSQSEHGLQHQQEYHQYHKYCTNKLTRLRHHQAVRKTLVRNGKYVEGTKPVKKHAYCQRDVIPSNVITHENQLWELFYQAERAWAMACELQQQQSSNKTLLSSTNKKKNKNPHQYVLRRLHKATKWATLLADKVANAKVPEKTEEDAENGTSYCLLDQQSILECKAYAAWMKANTALEQKDYLTAFRSYKTSMNILLQLANESATSTSTSNNNKNTASDRLALADLWRTRAETVIRPLVRFCGYEARDKLDPAELQEPETSANSKGTSTNSASAIQLSFRGKEIDLDEYKELAVLYLKMENSLTDTTSTQQSNTDSVADDNQFLQLLTDLDDALRLVQQELSHYEALPAGPAVTAKCQELQALKGYFQYQKLSLWRRQQEGRIQDLTDDAEIVHVYDTLQQNAQAMADLPALSLSEDEGNLEEDPYWLEAQAHILRIRAHRCYHLARLYESVSSLNGTPSDVMALLRQSSKLAKRAQEEVAACEDMGDADMHLQGLDELLSKIEIMACRTEARQYLLTATANDTSRLIMTNRPLWLRLQDLDAGTKDDALLVDDPPLPIPVPCKPSFYDLAWQHVPHDVPLDEIENFVAQHGPKPKKSGGLFGWFG